VVVEKAVAKADETVVDEEAVEKVEGVAEQEPGGEMEEEEDVDEEDVEVDSRDSHSYHSDAFSNGTASMLLANGD
jgi:hypothetical protein